MRLSIVNLSKVGMGILLAVWFFVLVLISINTTLSITDKHGCFRSKMIHRKNYICSTFKRKYRELVLERCPPRMIQLLKENICLGDD